ncbi:hypothetical protein Zmor_006291 [Zophobas morio]|uniref:Tyr recombinase domain-containing protein n=1 Tax=Zophobas morio TaxID=2755281 RepID=A0AA38IX37_9CUCU|nr:hypothetical protein Zmor_006291 [Zophobas morio]
MLTDDVDDCPDSKTHKPRRFVVVNGQDIDNIVLYRKYIALKPFHITHRRLFSNYKKRKCTVQPVGLHTFGKIPGYIAGYLNLPNPKEYSGHCLRRSSATLLVGVGGNLTTLKRHGGWQGNCSGGVHS